MAPPQGRARWTLVLHIDSGHKLEQFAGHMDRCAGTRRCHVDLARIGLGIGDELGNRVDGNRWMEHHDVGCAAVPATGVTSRKLLVERVIKRGADRARHAAQ